MTRQQMIGRRPKTPYPLIVNVNRIFQQYAVPMKKKVLKI